MRATPSYRPVRPSLVFGLSEGTRALSELGRFYAARSWLRRGQGGSGRPVLVIPGLLAGDCSTHPLRRLLVDVGYDTHGWGLGINIGPTERAIRGLDELLQSIRDRHRAPVSIVGQSLGGFLGAELARRHPGSVERLITLGSPMTITDLRQSRAGLQYNLFRSQHLLEFEFDKWCRAPRPQIPSTSVYSRSDGLNHWQACLYPDSELTENIEVCGSHLGMAVLPTAVYAVLDRLAVPVGDNWRRFQAPATLRANFPTPERIFQPLKESRRQRRIAANR
jgi:pimeloyl-ACP methyl ester carboxylesterase